MAQGDRILFRRAYGMANIAQNTAANPTTRFCIGSMGKMFTAVATLQLAQGGSIRLEAAIASYLPKYPNATLAKKVTVEQLLTQTACTGDIFGPACDGHRDLSPAKFIELYGTRDLEFEPGSKWFYSNYGYIVLRQSLSRCRERIATPTSPNTYSGRLACGRPRRMRLRSARLQFRTQQQLPVV